MEVLLGKDGQKYGAGPNPCPVCKKDHSRETPEPGNELYVCLLVFLVRKSRPPECNDYCSIGFCNHQNKEVTIK